MHVSKHLIGQRLKFRRSNQTPTYSKKIDKEALEAGVNTMLKIAASLLGKKRSRDGQQLLKNDDSGDKKE